MNRLIKWSRDNFTVVLLMCGTLGLAPFNPEPHVWEKLKWITAGAKGMQWFDYFDLLLHGSPWVLLVLGLIGRARPKEEAAS